ncbi:MAG: Txe/YoeB family addiction module toxin [Clostridia bacterium]|jgi:toxin YoeB|nr:Txe/YoeB family addiction module toxin [Clostridia bacterium]
MQVLWHESGWDDYIWWQSQDKKTLKRINALIKDMQRTPYEGIGKPEPLKENLTGWWSRRIDETNRIVYRVKDNALVIAACRNHYDDE